MIQTYHSHHLITPATIEYSITQHIVWSDRMLNEPTMDAFMQLQNYTTDQWIQMAQPFHMYSIPTEIHMNRTLIPTNTKNSIVYEIIITRRNNPYQWNINHVFYYEDEKSPFVSDSRKRTYEEMIESE